MILFFIEFLKRNLNNIVIDYKYINYFIFFCKYETEKIFILIIFMYILLLYGFVEIF